MTQTKGSPRNPGRFKPVIDRVFALEQAKEGLEYLARGRAKGKVVVKIR
ncbi:hypothetical protein CFBP6109_03385 [Pseudomonas syringae pv. cerasicola]|nr:hypothetical protein CFBP6109_03385 [Pseudomonas syringae pv. cerasicola]SPF14452.1 hypothetical protein PSCFBP6110_01948 [Pseudomonas syringae pv. cerasicola]